MTPTDFARGLVNRSVDREDHVLAVAIITRGLTDDDPATLRQGWPLDRDTVASAATFLSLTPADDLVTEALALAPTLSDAILNKGAAR